MFYDYHTHSFFSDDSDTPLTLMLDAGVKAGLAEMAVTDHYDPGYPDAEFPFELPFEEYHRELEKKQEEYSGRIRLVKGIEIGIQHDQLEKCRKAARSYDYDYIIGSFHCACAEPLYNGHFFDGKSARQIYEDYYSYVLANLREYDDFCNLGHLNIIDRYAPEIAPFEVYSDLVEEILRHLIENGHGIELNTSSFRYNMAETCPSEKMLRLYRSLGGEIITTGSDAHYPEHVAYNFKFACEYLESLGFRYLASYRQRKPDFIPLRSL